MLLAIPKFQYRFVPAMGNAIHPGNFHPVGSQVAAERMIARVAPGSAGPGEGAWIIVGGSGGFGSAARAVLGRGRGASTLNVSFDPQPMPESNNKIRKLGSPAYHRNLALERSLRASGTVARTVNGDAFDPAIRERVVQEIREHFGGKIAGLVWALAAPRAVDPRTGKAVASALKPLGTSTRVKTFSGDDPDAGKHPQIVEMEIGPGTPEEAIRTVFVMGGGIVHQWLETLLAADVLAPGFCLLTISYRGNDNNASVYRNGLIGLAKADLEFQTDAMNAVLAQRLGGRALAVEGPAVVTEASGGIPGVPFYMAHLLDVMGDRFEDPLASMHRLFAEKLAGEPQVDEHGLVRMDDRELAADVQDVIRERFQAAHPGSSFDRALYERFMREYAATRGFEIEGVDYDAEFDTDAVCR